MTSYSGHGDAVTTEGAVVKASCSPHTSAEVEGGGARLGFHGEQCSHGGKSKSRGP